MTIKNVGSPWTVHLNNPVLIHNISDCNDFYYVHKSPENGFWPIRAFWKRSSKREKAEHCFYCKHYWWLQMKRKEWEVWTVSLLKLRAKFVLQPIFFPRLQENNNKKSPTNWVYISMPDLFDNLFHLSAYVFDTTKI